MENRTRRVSNIRFKILKQETAQTITLKLVNTNKIIDNIDIELHEGEIVSLLGVSGGGKTTLFNIIAGISKPDSGKVYLDGEDITGRSGLVSYMLQKDMLLPYKTVLDNVALPLVIKGMKKREADILIGTLQKIV